MRFLTLILVACMGMYAGTCTASDLFDGGCPVATVTVATQQCVNGVCFPTSDVFNAAFTDPVFASEPEPEAELFAYAVPKTTTQRSSVRTITYVKQSAPVRFYSTGDMKMFRNPTFKRFRPFVANATCQQCGQRKGLLRRIFGR